MLKATLFLITSFAPLLCYSSPDNKIPLEHFVREPSWTHVKLSPDGSKLLSIKGENEISSLVSYEIDKEKYHVILKDTNNEWDFTWSKWLDNEHFLVGTRIATVERRYKQYIHQQYIGHYTGGKFERIIGPTHSLYPVFQIVSWLESDHDHILLSTASRPKGPAVFRYNIDKRRLNPKDKKIGAPYSKAISYAGRKTRWVSDSTGRYFSGVFYDDNVRRVYFRDDKERTQSLLWEYSMLDFEKEDPHPKFIYPIGFETGKPILYVKGLHDNRMAIYKIDLSEETQKFILVAANDRYDLDGRLISSPKDGRPVGIYHTYNGFSAHYWDKSYLSLKKGIDKSLPGSNAIISTSQDESKYVVLHTSPEYPGAYFLGNRTTKELDYIGSWFPELIETEIPKKEQFNIKARDNLELEIYVTRPQMAENSLSPVVVIPHEGPFGKDTRNFDLMPAFLADRGYTVLQVNYRGSHGYGLDFFLKSKRNYGLAVQNDIEDATRWLIKNKNIDPNRICIMGKEFGGYSALMGLANKPELYKCGISFAGITDLIDWSTHNMLVYGYTSSFLNIFFGSRWSDRRELKESSPVNLTEKITQPVLLMHGKMDINVPVGQSNKFYKKLKKNNKQVHYIRFKEGDHFLSNYSYRKQYFQEVENFLEKHL